MKKIAFILGLSMFAPALYAEETPAEVGVAFLVSPAQLGLNGNVVRVMPWYYKEYNNGWYFDVREGIGKRFIHNDKTIISVTGWYDSGRLVTLHNRLKGLQDVKLTPTLNAFLEHKLNNRHKVLASLHKSIGQHNGVKGTMALERLLVANTANLFLVKASINLRYTDRAYANAFYGVSQAEATALASTHAYNAYTAKAGIDYVGVDISMQKRIGTDTYIKGKIDFGRVQGSVLNSPISNTKHYKSIALVFGTYF